MPATQTSALNAQMTHWERWARPTTEVDVKKWIERLEKLDHSFETFDALDGLDRTFLLERIHLRGNHTFWSKTLTTVKASRNEYMHLRHVLSLPRPTDQEVKDAQAKKYEATQMKKSTSGEGSGERRANKQKVRRQRRAAA